MQSKDRTYQVIAIVALVIGVCALTVGFAAFTNNLTISSHAEVSPGSSVLDVVFSTSNSSVVTGSVVGTASGTSGASGATATLTNTTVTGIQANFTEPGQKVTYDFYVYNNSAFTGYLTGIAFNNVSGEGATKVCAPKSGSSNPATTGYTEACNDITLKLTVGPTGSPLVTGISESKSAAQVNDVSGLAAGAAYPVVVEIEYVSATPTPHTADGDFSVNFGDIVLTYSSVKGV